MPEVQPLTYSILCVTLFVAIGVLDVVRRQPARTERTQPPTASSHAFNNELGVQAAGGFWDPIWYKADGDETASKRHRQTELKHGRISMLTSSLTSAPGYFRRPRASSSQSFRTAGRRCPRCRRYAHRWSSPVTAQLRPPPRRRSP